MTEKEKIEMQRKAFVEGFMDRHKNGVSYGAGDEAWRAAERLYPVPRVPRVVTMANGEVARVVDGQMQFMSPTGNTWTRYAGQWSYSAWTAENYRTLFDLLAQPYEP